MVLKSMKVAASVRIQIFVLCLYSVIERTENIDAANEQMDLTYKA